jgi:hypothetical protein
VAVVSERCPSAKAGVICPDDLCRWASEETLCGAYLEDFDCDDDCDDVLSGNSWPY